MGTMPVQSLNLSPGGATAGAGGGGGGGWVAELVADDGGTGLPEDAIADIWEEFATAGLLTLLAFGTPEGGIKWEVAGDGCFEEGFSRRGRVGKKAA